MRSNLQCLTQLATLENLKSNRLFNKINFFFVLQGGESEHINLKVLGQDNAVVQFKIKKHTPLRKLMNAYCDRAVSIYDNFNVNDPQI